MNGDKKKMLVLGVLALLLVAVGAFSFLSGGNSGASAELVAKTEEAVKEAEEGTDPNAPEGDVSESDPTKNPDGTPKEGLLAMVPLAPRDPFTVPPSLDTRPKVDPVKPAPEPVIQPTATISTQRPTGQKPFDPGMNPLPGGSGGIGDGSPIEVVPQYAVKGIILGAKPLAVFQDSSGNQKLVSLGGSIDGDTKVVAIEKGKVTVSYKGKRQTLVIDEEARND